MFWEELAGHNGWENTTTEFKAALNRDDITGWLKTVAGFANADGGTLYIGVEDETHKLIGFDRKGADAERNYFNNQVNEHLSPRPALRIACLPYRVKEKERYILRVHVERSPVRPVILKYKGVPAIYMRRDGFTNGATYEEIIAMSIQSQPAQFDTLPASRTYRREEFRELLQFYRERNDGREYTDKALRSIGFHDAGGKLTNGAVLFADDYDGTKTLLQCSAFAGFTKGSDRIVTVNRFRGNILRSIRYACDFIAQRMNHTIIKAGDTRQNLDAYPARAVWEGIVNAIAHRDYFLDGTQIQVDMFRDRLEISSPGSFYLGAPIQKTYDLSSIISKRRNELICAVLVACNAMEAAGTGFDKIAEEYAAADSRHKPYILSASDHFTLVLPDLTYAGGTTMTDVKLIHLPVPHGTEHDDKVLAFCFHKAHKASEIADYLGLRDSTYFRRKVLQNLTDEAYLLASKDGRARYYRTNPAAVRRE
ncbi:MAG: putative DNA binding domain-containing protein [Schwartzia sp.]|nr:putative DNA binding domain-containing protein [Schwartzia sp. (in: firmicutes)]